MPIIETHWITKERVYGILVLLLFLGILFPALAVVSKLSANNFSNFYYIVQHIPGIDQLIQHFPFLDIGKSLPGLSDWSWHAQWNQRSFPQYGLLNLFLLCLVFFHKAKILGWLQQVVDWLYDQRFFIPKRVIVICICMIVFSFLLKIHIGFWFPGIGGWTYASWESKFRESPPDTSFPNEKFSIERVPFLEKALISHNAEYLPGLGYIKGKAIFLHFNHGEILPGNLELTGLVYTEYVFGRQFDHVNMHQPFFSIVKASLEKRRTGREFLLPESISYPSHVKFMPINYSNYPPADELREISFWTLLLSIDPNRQVKIINAYKELEIKGE